MKTIIPYHFIYSGFSCHCFKVAIANTDGTPYCFSTSQLLQVYNPHTDIVVLYYLKEFSLVPRTHPAFHHLQLGEPGNEARKCLFWYLSDSK